MFCLINIIKPLRRDVRPERRHRAHGADGRLPLRREREEEREAHRERLRPRERPVDDGALRGRAEVARRLEEVPRVAEGVAAPELVEDRALLVALREEPGDRLAVHLLALDLAERLAADRPLARRELVVDELVHGAGVLDAASRLVVLEPVRVRPPAGDRAPHAAEASALGSA